MLKNIFCAVIICLPLIFCACDYKELDDTVFVAGMAVDFAEDGKYIVTVETITMSKEGNKGEYKPEIISVTGKTILEALSDMISITSGKLNLNHCQIVIFSEEIKDIGELVRAMYKYREFDLNTVMFVAKDNKAGEILAAVPVTSRSQSFELRSAIENEAQLEKAVNTKLYYLFEKLHEKNQLLPVVSLHTENEKETVSVYGGAIFSEGKFIDFLTGEEMRFYLLAKGKIRSGIMSVPYDKTYLSAKIDGNKTKMTPQLENGKLKIHIEIDTQISFIGEIPDGFETDAPKLAVSKYISGGVGKLLKKAQTEFSCDIMEFSSWLYKYHTDIWKTIEVPENIFADTEFIISCNVKIKPDVRISGVFE